MSAGQIRADVDRGLEIIAEQERLKNELAVIEARLEAAGLAGEQVDLKDADREGKQFLAAGTGQIVPVIFTADKLLGSFSPGSAAQSRIRVALGEKNAFHLGKFFKPKTSFENQFDNGKKFRTAAQEFLGPNAAPFITACVARDKAGIPKSDIKVCWKLVEAV